MSISATSIGAIVAPDATTTKDSAPDDKTTAQFAGLFAGAVQAQTPKPVAPKPKDGTSELDGSATAGDETTGASDDATAVTGATIDATSATLAALAATSTNTVVRSVGALDPALQAKLARVIQRVQDETGHTVQVGETYRSQARQNALFAQGRDTTGPVVTWTQNSKHTQGRAVDLVLDGGAAAPEAYSSLQRIAAEEGLRTLGAKDPGHVELPGTGTATSRVANGAVTDTTLAVPVKPADASGSGQVSIARLAQVGRVTDIRVAQPAQVARVASVASVATVAPGGVPAGAATSANAQARSATAAQTDLIARTGAQTPAGTQVPSGGTERPGVQTQRGIQAAPDTLRPSNPQAKPASFAGAPNAQGKPVSGVASQTGGTSAQTERDATGRGSQGDQRGGYSTLAPSFTLRDSSAVAGTSGTIGTTAAERTVKVIEAIQDAPARPLSQLTMSVDSGDGVTDRIHVAMRGSSLNTTIDVSDPRAAQSITSRGDELVRSLSRDGIDLESMRVRSATATAAPVATPSSQGSSDSSTNSRAQRGDPWQQQDRQKSQDERRQQQREQRGDKQK